MPDFRVTTFFGQANMGWSETWWLNRSGIPQVSAETARLLDFRNDLLTAQHSILACRIATEGSRAQSVLLLPGRQQVSGGTEIINIPSQGDYPEGSTALQYDQVRANLHIAYMLGGRKLSIRYLVGIPDVSSKTEAATLNGTDPAQWWIRFNNLHQYMQTVGWGIKCQLRGSGNPEKTIKRWVRKGTPPSVVGVQLAQGTTLDVAAGDKVQILGVRMSSDGIRTPNATWYVDDVAPGNSTDGPTIYLRGSEVIDPETIRIMGKYRPMRYEYLPFDQVRPLRVGIHKRGKPFNSPRGRVRTKRFAA